MIIQNVCVPLATTNLTTFLIRGGGSSENLEGLAVQAFLNFRDLQFNAGCL